MNGENMMGVSAEMTKIARKYLHDVVSVFKEQNLTRAVRNRVMPQ